MSKILIVEDHKASLEALAELVSLEGNEVLTAGDLATARPLLEQADIDLVLTDLMLPDGQGLDLLAIPDRSFEVVLITGKASVETAIVALRRGAADYLTKPVNVPRLKALLTQFRRNQDLKEEVSNLRTQLQEVGHLGQLIGASSAMQEIYRLIQKVAATDATVLITGDSGTGKEVVAQTLHALGSRRNQPLIPINCGAVSPTLIESELFGHERGSFTGADARHTGHFERADGGTLFLDEITEMPPELQVKLLRVLETSSFLRVGGTKPVEVDVRILAASNRDPLEAIQQGKLREDLYYRLRVFPIHLPPLRDRDRDIELLSRKFLDEINSKQDSDIRISDRALEILNTHSWPGNVRELKNVLRRAVILADRRIEPTDLPQDVRLGDDVDIRGNHLRVAIGSKLEDVEKRLILATLSDNDDRRKETAEALGISQKTLYNRLKAYDAS